eukprot:TRINITY_DN20505_c0_g1_i2.p1 TRINITY_DN20505_c0_g1~~TRINITY_DN20505_c0_g1_i2.p1  ORF type:complete len:247 (-),score=63.56 TRINITY_DN20505_c0_g1_i2:81-821(-)
MTTMETDAYGLDADAAVGAGTTVRFPRLKRLVLQEVERDATALSFLLEDIRDDKQIIMAAVEQDGTLLRFASERLQADFDVVLKSVLQTPAALEYSAGELRDSDALRVSRRQHELEMWRHKVTEDWRELQAAPGFVKADMSIVFDAVQQDEAALGVLKEARMPDQELLERVKPFVKHFEATKRRIAVLALGQAGQKGNTDFMEAVAEGLEDGDLAVRQAACEVLPRLAEKGDQALVLSNSFNNQRP